MQTLDLISVNAYELPCLFTWSEQLEGTAVALASAIPLPAAVSMRSNLTIPVEMVLYRWVKSWPLAHGTWWSYVPSDNIRLAAQAEIRSGWEGSQKWNYFGLVLKCWLPTKPLEKVHHQLQGWGCESVLDRCSLRASKIQTALKQSW